MRQPCTGRPADHANGRPTSEPGAVVVAEFRRDGLRALRTCCVRNAASVTRALHDERRCAEGYDEDHRQFRGDGIEIFSGRVTLFREFRIIIAEADDHTEVARDVRTRRPLRSCSCNSAMELTQPSWWQ